MRRILSWQTMTISFTVTAIVYARKTRQLEGTLFKAPYDFRMSIVQRLRDRFWNPKDPRLFTPSTLGGTERIPSDQVASIRQWQRQRARSLIRLNICPVV